MFPLFDNSLQLSTAITKTLENLPFVRHLPRSAPNPQWTLPDQSIWRTCQRTGRPLEESGDRVGAQGLKRRDAAEQLMIVAYG
jgi:hypothetical protein